MHHDAWKKTQWIIIVGATLGTLALGLEFARYRFLILQSATELYILLVSAVFLGVGIWAGRYVRDRQEIAHLKRSSTSGIASTMERGELSEREVEVLVLIAQGLTNPQIADQLFVSVNTVKTHTSSIFSKLNVKGRLQAVQRATELGILARMGENPHN